MKTTPTARSLSQFRYFSQCQDPNRLPHESVKFSDSGLSADEWFHVHETHGKALAFSMPCREVELVHRALNGKAWHGLTVTMVAEDFVGDVNGGRLIFASDLESYPDWVKRDILGRAKEIAMDRLGFIPSFVLSGCDFSNTEYTDESVKSLIHALPR